MNRSNMMMAAMMSIAALGGMPDDVEATETRSRKRHAQRTDHLKGAWRGDGVPSKVPTKAQRDTRRAQKSPRIVVKITPLGIVTKVLNYGRYEAGRTR